MITINWHYLSYYMIQRRIDTDISNWVLLSKENFITFEFKAIAKHIEKSDISLDDAGKIIINCSILEIPDSFLVQCRKNQMLYSPYTVGQMQVNIKCIFSRLLNISSVQLSECWKLISHIIKALKNYSSIGSRSISPKWYNDENVTIKDLPSKLVSSLVLKNSCTPYRFWTQ